MANELSLENFNSIDNEKNNRDKELYLRERPKKKDRFNSFIPSNSKTQRINNPTSYNYKSILIHVIPQEIEILNKSCDYFKGRLVFVSQSYENDLNQLNCCPTQRFYEGDEVYIHLNEEHRVSTVKTLRMMVLDNNTNTLYIRFNNDEYSVKNNQLIVNPSLIEAAKKQSLNTIASQGLPQNLIDSDLSISLSLNSNKDMNPYSSFESSLNERAEEPTYVIIRTHNNYDPLQLNSYIGGGWSSLPEACSAAKQLINPKDDENYIQGLEPNQIQILQSTGLKVNAIFNLSGKHLL